MSRPLPDRAFAASVAIIAWSALFLQYALLVRATLHGIGPALATLRFLSFFTILSNLLVALTTTFAALAGSSAPAGLFARPRVRGAAALCIGITCGIYFFVLATKWSPQGLQWLADVALHYAVPGLYLAWWLACVPHRRLQWGDALRWLSLPLAFLAWTLLRGAWLHEYPYPFVNVDELGVAAVVRNCAGIGVLFLLFGFVLVGIDRVIGRRARGIPAA